MLLVGQTAVMVQWLLGLLFGAHMAVPAPGVVSVFAAPAGPGVRVDSGVESGSEISGAFDSLLAKIIVTGEDRQQALERSRRALAEMRVEGMATVLPFHQLLGCW